MSESSPQRQPPGHLKGETSPATEKPEWIRPADTRKYFGISRSWAYDLINEGAIDSKLIRKRGKLTGIRLISYDSLKAYIESQPAE